MAYNLRGDPMPSEDTLELEIDNLSDSLYRICREFNSQESLPIVELRHYSSQIKPVFYKLRSAVDKMETIKSKNGRHQEKKVILDMFEDIQNKYKATMSSIYEMRQTAGDGSISELSFALSPKLPEFSSDTEEMCNKYVECQSTFLEHPENMPEDVFNDEAKRNIVFSGHKPGESVLFSENKSETNRSSTNQNRPLLSASFVPCPPTTQCHINPSILNQNQGSNARPIERPSLIYSSNSQIEVESVPCVATNNSHKVSSSSNEPSFIYSSKTHIFLQCIMLPAEKAARASACLPRHCRATPSR